MNNTNSIPDKLYEILRDEILFMKLLPGQMISEIEVSKKFNVSRTPVRDAFKRLEKDKLIEVKPHVGTFITLIDLDEITDIMYIREKVEVAIMKDLSLRLQPEQLFKLNIMILKQKELIEQKDPNTIADEFVKLDNEFHQLIFEIAGKQGIWQYINDLQFHYQRLRSFIDLSDINHIKYLYNAHETIVEAIKNKDFDKLDDVFSHHLYDGIQNGTALIMANKSYFKHMQDL